MSDPGLSEVTEWYRNKTIFITGGTGFMGKVLVEKILRSCPVRRVYLLMRPKKGVDVEQRLDDMFNYKLFDRIKQSQPEVLQKVFAVKGDITMEGLGLSDEDEARLAEEVNVLFHAAATINFTEPMRVAVNMNMLGTKRMISLAKKMSHLEALVHVSTAYANCHLPEVYEDLYPAPMDPGRLIQLTEWLDDKLLEEITPRLVEPRPNTYTYTKALAEHLLFNDGENLPIAVIRPSIVCGSWREPVPGWVDNLFAFTGLLVGMGKGVLRSLYVKQGIKLDFIPVDVPINLMLVSAWNTAAGRYKPDTVPIYCCSTGSQQPLTIEALAEYLKKSVRAYPFNSPLWYPDGSAKSSKVLHTLHVYCANIIPAYVADTIMRILGKKPVAVKLCNKMVKAISALEYFMLRDWTFHTTKTQNLWKSLSPVDQDLYHFDVSDLDWDQYIEAYQKGCKQFIMKEDMDSLPHAHKMVNRMYVLHRVMQVIMMYGVYCLLSTDTATSLFTYFFNGASRLLSLAPAFVAAEEAEIS